MESKKNDDQSSYFVTLDGDKITTIVFDVDDTLYDVSTGFTGHRLAHGAVNFMMEKLGFDDYDTANRIREEYFKKYHSTAKALTVAEKEGKLPKSAPKFDTKDLSEWWATKLDFSLLHEKEDNKSNSTLKEILMKCPLKKVVFSNGPRKYVKRVLQELDLQDVFLDEFLFAVDDVLPYCKPEKEAFDFVLKSINVCPQECIMVEDSMKNIRAAKSIGMKTVLVVGKGNKMGDIGTTVNSKMGDEPLLNDPSVDRVIETCLEIQEAWQEGLW